MIDLLDAIPDVLLAAAGENTSQLQWDTMSQVGGALVRVCHKRSGLDQQLANEFLLDAYRDEFLRVLRGWPFTGYILLPTVFFQTACWIRQLLVTHYKLPPQKPLPAGFLPAIVDCYPAFAIVNGNRWLYASPQWLRLFKTRGREMIDGTYDVARSAPGVEVLELAHPIPNEHGEPIGTVRIADRAPLLASLDLRRFAVSFAIWGGLLREPARR